MIFAMQLHGGNIKKWDCIAQFFTYVRCAAKWESGSTKNAHNHGEMASTEAGSKELTKNSASDDLGDVPP